MDQQVTAHTTPQTVDWGLTQYQEALDKQLTYVQERIANQRADTLVFNEHHPVYTMGKRIGTGNHLIWQAEQLKKVGIEVAETNRGGDITYHGPGQIVGYPIMSLRGRKDLHAYLRDLEEVIIQTLKSYGLDTSRREGMTGIWLGNRKIAAIGVAVKQWVTYHGFALNVQPNMSHFNGIVPCGLHGTEVTSLKEECQQEFDMDAVKRVLEVEFWKIFTHYASYGQK